MRQTLSYPMVLLLTAFFVLTLSGCSPASPEAQVTATRAQYTVRLESFSAHEQEVEEPAMEEMATMEGEAAEATAGAAETAAGAAETAAGAAETAAVAAEVAEGEGGEDGMEMEAMDLEEASGPRPTDIILHLLVRFNGDTALPGITVEVTQQDPFGKEKEPTLQWIDTADMSKSDVKQVDLKLEGIDYEDGDGFSVLLSQAVSAEERGQYREYAEAAP